MKIAGIILIGCGLFILSSVSFAGELITQASQVYYDQGVKLQQQGDYIGAQIAYRKFLVLSPKDGEHRKYIMNNVGIMYVKEGKIDLAEESFREVLRLDSAFMPAKLNLGLIYDMRENEIKALQYWANLFEVEKMKPKDFVLVGAPAPQQ